MSIPLRLISSMATRQVLDETLVAYTAHSGQAVQAESVGGVDAARRVAAGEAFDGVVLAANAIDTLIASGRALSPRVDWVRSGVYVAVRADAQKPAIDSEDAVCAAVLAATGVGFSTGPSGVHLAKLFERWGIAAALQDRIVQAPAGVPVARLLAEGRVSLGFQQLSELLNAPGIQILGPLPDAIQIVTTFSGAVCATAADPQRVRALLDWLSSPATAPAVRRQGMEPA